MKRVTVVVLATLTMVTAPLVGQDEALSAGKSRNPKSTWNPQFHPAVRQDEFLRQGAAFAKTPDGRIVRYSAKTDRISDDNGQTWSERRPVPIGDHTGSAAQLAVTPSGVLVLAYMNSAESVWEWDSGTKEISADSTLPVYALRSTDEGKTWTEPQRIFDGRSGALTDILADSSGSVILPITGFRREPARLVQFVMVTRDEGLTWTRAHHRHRRARAPRGRDGADPGRAARRPHLDADPHQSRCALRELSPATAGDLVRGSSHVDQRQQFSRPPPSRLASGRLILGWNQVRPEGMTEAEWKTRPLARRGGDFGDDRGELASRGVFPRLFRRRRPHLVRRRSSLPANRTAGSATRASSSPSPERSSWASSSTTRLSLVRKRRREARSFSVSGRTT